MSRDEVPAEVRALADGLELAERHRGMGDYVEAYLGLRRDVEAFLAARTPSTDQRTREEAAEDGNLRFGDAVTNLAASDDNPIKHGWYVRRGVRKGRMNAGPFMEYITDDGRVHQTPPDNLLRRSASTISADHPRDRDIKTGGA